MLTLVRPDESVKVLRRGLVERKPWADLLADAAPPRLRLVRAEVGVDPELEACDIVGHGNHDNRGHRDNHASREDRVLATAVDRLIDHAMSELSRERARARAAIMKAAAAPAR